MVTKATKTLNHLSSSNKQIARLNGAGSENKDAKEESDSNCCVM